MKVNEIFGPTIQGEGTYSGVPAIFVRLAGCNQKCSFCDTDFKDSREVKPKVLVQELINLSEGVNLEDYILVFTGGEPLLQLKELKLVVRELEEKCIYIPCHLETNGSLGLRYLYLDHISCSPKTNLKDIKLKYCHDIKLLYPYINDLTPDLIESRIEINRNKFIQPIIVEGNKEKTRENIDGAIQEVIRLGKDWRISMQLHKLIGVR